MLDGDLVLGPVTGTYYSLIQKEISNIPTVTPSLFNQTCRITRHNVSVTGYKIVTKNGHDWSPASTPLTTYVIGTLRIREIKPFRMVECSKSYCKSCNFQKVSRKPVGTLTL